MIEKISGVSIEIKKILETQIFPSKRIRSYILHILCKNNLDKVDYYSISTAIELFQQATLIFDDVIDNTDNRDGGRIALHKRFGGNIEDAGKADHIASVLMILAEQELEKINDINIMQEFTKIRLEMFRAQLVDIFVIPKPEYISYIEWLLEESYKKTSSFMKFPFSIYSIKTDLSKEQRDKLEEVGRSIGILYQIGDDLFDIENGIKPGSLALTYQLAYLLDNIEQDLVSKEEKIFIEALIEKKNINNNDALELTKIFRNQKKNIIESAMKYFKEYSEKIENNLSENLEIKEDITNLLNKILNTKYWKYEV
jgi:geranylgeranyl pyrophosphate synthase